MKYCLIALGVARAP